MADEPKDITEVIPGLAAVVTAKEVRPEQLAAELGVGQVWGDGARVLAQVPQAALEAAIAAHTADPDYDLPAERKVPPAIRAKLADAAAGRVQLGAAEMSVVVARLALRLAR